MAAMRLLLILALICSALTMVSPATAAPAGLSADCHSMDRHPGPGQRSQGEKDSPRVLHACPGCAFLVPIDRAAAPAALASIRHEPEAAPTYRSLATSPIPPLRAPPDLSLITPELENSGICT